MSVAFLSLRPGTAAWSVRGLHPWTRILMPRTARVRRIMGFNFVPEGKNIIIFYFSSFYAGI
jgi:hypothetical protein